VVKNEPRLQESFSDDDYRIIEKNAKFLASCILMPREAFKSRFEHFTAIQSQKTANYLNVLKYTVRQLNLDFNVSCFSISLRALHLRLIDQQQLEDLLETF